MTRVGTYSEHILALGAANEKYKPTKDTYTPPGNPPTITLIVVFYRTYLVLKGF